jgi:hypothetical protein
MKKWELFLSGAALVATTLAVPSSADSLASSMGIYLYPADGQSADQQAQDDYECFSWAKEQSNYDPMNPTQVVAQEQDSGPSGARLQGAARGAVGGAVVGEIADDNSSDGAKAGAALGAMRGGRQQRKGRHEAEEQAEAAADQQELGMENEFKNAYGACIEARGYSVKF